MAPDKRKGEQSPRDAAAEERERVKQGRKASHDRPDEREEEGWSQPESSAQKTPPER